jgi:hypothetical protein
MTIKVKLCCEFRGNAGVRKFRSSSTSQPMRTMRNVSKIWGRNVRLGTPSLSVTLNNSGHLPPQGYGVESVDGFR